MGDKVKGNILDYDDDPPHDISWRFYPKRTGGRISELDIIRELFDCGMEGNLYVSLLKIPEEYPVEGDEGMNLYEPETACKILADWCGYKLLDRDGREL